MNQLDPGDLAYHAFVHKQLADAQAVANAWGRYLAQKYKLTQADNVNERGEINGPNSDAG